MSFFVVVVEICGMADGSTLAHGGWGPVPAHVLALSRQTGSQTGTPHFQKTGLEDLHESVYRSQAGR